MNFCILGAGAWGTAIAVHLHRDKHTVTLLPRRLEHATAIATTRENAKYLPGVALSEDIQIALEVKPALMEADVVLLACPSQGLRPLAEQILPHLATSWRTKLFVSLCKGLERNTLLRPSQVLAEVLPGIPHGVISGPTNAAEVAKGLPCAVVFATDSESETVLRVQEEISGKTLRVYRSQDVAGVELGGILKNIYAIGAGICDGLQLGSNAKAAFLTRSIQEMVRLGTAAGGRAETFYGLSGVGDLIATAHGDWSRNRKLGEAIARTRTSPAGYLNKNHVVVEGYWAAECFHQFAEKNAVAAPILETLHGVLYGGTDLQDGIEALMRRMLKPE